MDIFRALIVVVTLSCSSAFSYNYDGTKWPQSSTAFYVDIPGGDGLWNLAFEDAMAEWGQAGFKFSIYRGVYADGCADDGKNGVSFSYDECGVSFGSSTLAITSYSYVADELVEADIVFNANKDFDVFDGPLLGSINDFRRVALHELGHALGLDHEDVEDSIMSSYASDIDRLTLDDYLAVWTLYDLADGNDSFSEAKSLTFEKTYYGSGPTTTPGNIRTGIDYDYYKVTVPVTGKLSLFTFGSLNTRGQLYDSNQNLILTVDDNGASCGLTATNFCIRKTLTAGIYYLRVTGSGYEDYGNFSLVTEFTPSITVDEDGDGIVNFYDNCPLAVNVDQSDSDNDYRGDICDPYITKKFYGWPSRTGWVLESSEFSSRGGYLRPGYGMRLGDSATDRQYRSIVHFDTSSLPNSAVIAKASLVLKRGGPTYGSTSSLGSMLGDIRSGYFGSSSYLEIGDFESPSDKSSAVSILKVFGRFDYTGKLVSSALPYISKTSTTQFKLRFYVGDNDDSSADYLSFYNTSTRELSELVVDYYVP